MLINQKAVKQYALSIGAARHHKFTRVSKEFVLTMDAVLKNKIREHIQTLPSVGKTIK